MGGSLGGLTAALVLRDLGWDVDVYERARAPLEGRGAGIVLHPATVRYWVQNDVRPLEDFSAAARWLRYLGRDGAVAHEQPCRYRFTSYNALYRDLVRCFGADRYHLGHEVVGFEQRSGGVTVELAGGRRARGDLLVCADGIQSRARRQLLPDVAPQYAGYVGWRGTVAEADVSAATFEALSEAITYCVLPYSHFLTYPIPGADGSVRPGRRLINWLWYRNLSEGAELDDLMTDRSGARRAVSVGPGAVAPRHVSELRGTAASTLPAPAAELIARTPEPFVQAVFDIEVPQMAFGRACLIGDAAFALRPHAAVGTAKAAEDAWKLAEAMEACPDGVTPALERWQTGQLALGRAALERTREAGRRAQVESSWRVGDPLPFGLYQRSDSSLR